MESAARLGKENLAEVIAPGADHDRIWNLKPALANQGLLRAWLQGFCLNPLLGQTPGAAGSFGGAGPGDGVGILIYQFLCIFLFLNFLIIFSPLKLF